VSACAALIAILEIEGSPRLCFDVRNEAEERRLRDWLRSSSALDHLALELALLADALDDGEAA
jgi:hypothetical protein